MALTATDMSHLEVTTSLEQTDDGLLVCATCDTARPVELFSPTVRLGKLRPMKTCVYCRGLEPFPEKDTVEKTTSVDVEALRQEPEEEEIHIMSVLPDDRFSLGAIAPTHLMTVVDWLEDKALQQQHSLLVLEGGMILMRAEGTTDLFWIYEPASEGDGGGPGEPISYNMLLYTLGRTHALERKGICYC